MEAGVDDGWEDVRELYTPSPNLYLLLIAVQRHDEQALIDQGRVSNIVSIHYEREDLEGESLQVAVTGWGFVFLSPDTPSQQVQFILGTKEDEQHVPHDLFTELDETCVEEGEGAEWKETARWMKFEEDVDDGGKRWSKPCVGTVSLQSLFDLRSCILNGTVLLDICAKNIKEIADMILCQQEQSTEFDEHMWVKVRVLVEKHHHQDKNKGNKLFDIVHFFADESKKLPDLHVFDKPGEGSQASEAKNGVNQETGTMGLSKVELHFLKKIPAGTEVSNMLIGELNFLQQPIMAFVHLTPAVLSSMMEVPIPTRFLFGLLGPEGKGHQYHENDRSMAAIMTDEVFHDVAYKAQNRDDLVADINEFLDQVTVLLPGEWDPSIQIEPPKNVPLQQKTMLPGAPNDSASHSEMEKPNGPELERTGRLFGGLIRDVKRKAPWFWSDFWDGLRLQCLASFLFLYCTCMFHIITFGGLLGEVTDSHISAMESLLGASVTGMVYSLFAGQPLIILGSTGPILVFEKILYKFCREHALSYLSLRACIGLWTAFFCIVLVATDASSLVCYITRFTKEAFASVICLIFIYEALEKLSHLWNIYPVHMHSKLDLLTTNCKCEAPTHPSNETLRFWESNNITVSSIAWENLTVTECRYLHGEFQGPACGHNSPYAPKVLFWCCIVFFTTFVLSSLLKFKTSYYVPARVRSTVSDFAVFLTIVIMVLMDFMVGIPSPKLHVPHMFKPTRDDRGWFINPIGSNPWWTVLAALIPALLCTILIFMDQQITAVIVNRKEHRLKKGCGYHLDLFIVAVMLGVCSVMGLPWFVAVTILSITHVNSLKVESKCSAPGEQPKFLGIREQRVTGLMIFVLMGCSIFFSSLLKFIPMPVLYGVFLYMGVSSLRGIQFFDRLKLFWRPAKHQLDFLDLWHIPLRKVHLFTVIQLICLVLLWAIQVSRAAVIFPMIVFALIFVRKMMDFCFSKQELSFLDDLTLESKLLDGAKNEAEGEEVTLAGCWGWTSPLGCVISCFYHKLDLPLLHQEPQKMMEAAARKSVQLKPGKTSDSATPEQSSDR
uniref:Anion exchange protein n=1 Tax=Athene cunicularia TaxID=194338 RepID=A0A663NE00_ATHCN